MFQCKKLEVRMIYVFLWPKMESFSFDKGCFWLMSLILSLENIGDSYCL